MDIKFNFADAKSADDVVVGGDLGIVVLCKVARAKWYLTDIRGSVLFTGNTKKSCAVELERLIAKGKQDEAIAEAEAARSVANAAKHADGQGSSMPDRLVRHVCPEEA